jgi:hypothetical protein
LESLAGLRGIVPSFVVRDINWKLRDAFGEIERGEEDFW